MAEKKRTLDLLDRAYRAKAWHGPALLETLVGVDASMAAKRVVKGAHTIWELVDHLGSWNAIVAERLAGKTPQVTPDMNFPRTPSPTPAAWKKSLARLAASQRKFRAAVAKFPESQLGRIRPGTKTSWNVLIHGQMQHQLYHAGQIAMLRRGMGREIKQ
ncbi:MAG TPA: DinB family protein [Verrucomicrobiae bacterium]|nr:DinB family protein [Verrucomicrobiae bacterium]